MTPAVKPLKVAADCALGPTGMESVPSAAQWDPRPNPRDGPFSIWRPPEADPKEKPQYEAAGLWRPTAGRNPGPSWVRARNRILWPDRGSRVPVAHEWDARLKPGRFRRVLPRRNSRDRVSQVMGWWKYPDISATDVNLREKSIDVTLVL